MPRRASRRPRIVILGGGFAGLAAARELLPADHHVTLVDRSRWFEWLPNIHELLSGVKSPELLRLPLDRIVRRAGHRFVRDEVVGLDLAAGTVALRRRRPLRRDALLVGLGGVDATRGVSGVAEHALPFKSVDECHRIGRRLAQLGARRRPARVVIVGGGLEGVEALGEILRRHRESGLHVTLVEARSRLLAEAPAALDRHVRRLCAPHAVELLFEAPVERIEAASVELRDGRTLPSDLTIWTGGPAPPALLARSGLAPEGAWAPVDATLRSPAHPQVFVMGDAAEPPTPLAKQGYHALDMGVCAARNAARVLADDAARPFRPAPKPMLISFGDLSCFLVAGDRVLAGPALSGAKEAVYELVMAQLDGRAVTRRIPAIVRRARQAAGALLWPTLASPARLLRQTRLSLLRA